MKSDYRFDVLKASEVLWAMDTVIRYLNNEDVIENWLMNGVADGDGINEIAEYFIGDDEEDTKTFNDMCEVFWETVRAGHKDGWWIPPKMVRARP